MTARQHYEQMADEAREANLSQAEQEVADAILRGETVAGLTLNDCLNSGAGFQAPDIGPLVADLSTRLAALFAAKYRSDAHVLATADLQIWAETLVRACCKAGALKDRVETLADQPEEE